MAAKKTENDDLFDGESTGGVLFKWDEAGKSITGLYIGKREGVKTQLGLMTVYDLLTKEGEVAVPGTKGLNDQMKRIPANGSMIIGITYVEDKKGNFPNPFKVFSVKYGMKTEKRLEMLGINDSLFDAEAPGTEDGEE